jgi:hypothetical protein
VPCLNYITKLGNYKTRDFYLALLKSTSHLLRHKIQKLAAIMQREAVTVMPSCRGGDNLVVA